MKLRSLREQCNIFDVIQNVEHTINKQALTIENLQLDMRGVINNLNLLIKSVNVLNNQMSSTESNILMPTSIYPHIIEVNIIFDLTFV